IAALGRVLRAELETPAPGSHLAVHALIEAVAVRALRATPTRRDPVRAVHPGIRAALDLCESRYADDLTLDDLAAAAGLPRWPFGRLFREQVGRSPYRFLRDVRV